MRIKCFQKYIDVIRMKKKKINKKQYIFQNFYVTAIFTDEMLDSHCNLAFKWAGDDCFKRHNFLMQTENPLFKWHNKRKSKEIAWIYRKRFGAVLRTTITKEQDNKLIFHREIVGKNKNIKTKYFVLNFEKKRKYIEGITLWDEFVKYDLETTKKELLTFIDIVFEKYKWKNDKLHPKCYDTALANTIKDNKGELHFFDFEFKMIGGVCKDYLVYRIIRNAPFKQEEKHEIYAYITKSLNLETKWQYWDDFHAETEKDMLIPPKNENDYKVFTLYFGNIKQLPEKHNTTRKIKFAFVTHEFGLYDGHGGVASYVYNNAKKILDLNLDMEIYVLSRDIDEKSDLLSHNNFKLVKIYNDKDVYKELKKINPHYVEVADFGALALNALREKRKGNCFQSTIFAVMHHAATRECFEWNYKIPLPSEMSFLFNSELEQMNLADFQIAPSLFMKNYISINYSLKDNVYVIPHTFTKGNITSTENFADIDLYKSKFNILCVSRLDGIKNQSALINAFIKFVDDVEADSKLFLAGHSYTNALTGICFRDEFYNHIPPKYREKIYFFDYFDEEKKSAFRSISNVFVLPSIFETFSMSILEEVCSNMPIICSKYVGVANFLQDATPEMIYDPFNDSKLYETLLCFYKKTIKDVEELKIKQHNSIEKIINGDFIKEKLKIYENHLLMNTNTSQAYNSNSIFLRGKI